MKHTAPIRSAPYVVHVDGDALSLTEVSYLIGRLETARRLAYMFGRIETERQELAPKDSHNKIMED